MSDPRTCRTPRFWCHREGVLGLDEHAFLIDPEGGPPGWPGPGLVRLADEAGRDCLVLLGEPGMGKTTELDAESDRLAESSPDDLLVRHNLGEYGDESRLIRDVFEGPEWAGWREAGRTLHLFLDALDECRILLPQVAAVIVGRLRRLPHRDRLKLRITCRTGAWPSHLEAELVELWPGDRTAVFELAPLRRADVAAIAAAEGLGDVAAFLRDVERREVGPLASKPITLGMLVKLFRRGGQLPETRDLLYEQGCRALCDEPNRARRELARHRLLDVEQRLAVAARIAAMTVFCGRSAVWDGPDPADRPADDIELPELAGGAEAARGGEFAVTEEGVREVLADTALFSARGPGRMGWAHRTFAEHLAARHLVSRGLGVGQIGDLILHPHLPGRVVPQLHQAAAWLAGMDAGVARSIRESDPAVLLRGDVEAARPDGREALVEALLAAAADRRLDDIRLGARREYRKLTHPGLAPQLARFLGDRSRGTVARRMAIDIAQACGVGDLQGPLADLALERSEDATIRAEAACAVGVLGDGPTRRRLVPLLAPGPDEDPSDEVKGYALEALWPGLIAAGEVFEAITPRKRPDFYGAYVHFLREKLARCLGVADLPIALGWAAENAERSRHGHVLEQLSDQIMQRAWDEMDSPGIAGALAGAVRARIEAHADTIGPTRTGNEGGGFGVDEDKRRKLVLAILPGLAASDTEPGLLFCGHPRLALPGDFPWLVGRLDVEADPAIRIALAKLTRVAFLQSDPHPLAELLAAAGRHDELADKIRTLITPVALDSPEAMTGREGHESRRSLELRSGAEPPPGPPPAELVERYLDEAEAGDPDAWWRLTRVMTLAQSATDSGRNFESDLTALPGWNDAGPSTRARIVAAADRYLRERRPSPDQWFRQEDVTYWPDEAGYRAFRLLHDRAPDRFEALGGEAWAAWTPAIVGHAASGRPGDAEAHRQLVGAAFRAAPLETIDWLGRWLEGQCRREVRSLSTRPWADLPDADVAPLLMRSVLDPAVPVRAVRELLDDLLGRGVAEAREHATSLLAVPLPGEPGPRVRSLAAAISLMTCTPDAGWAAIWPAIRQEPEFGREFVAEIAPGTDRAGADPFLARLSESQVAEFYLWLERQFPHGEDREDDEDGYASGRMLVGWFRDGVLHHLRDRGTAAALAALGGIERELPELHWLPHVRLDAERAMMERTWTPPRPEDLRALAGDRRARLVDGGDQLLDVVIESLTRYGRMLRGETPAAFMLWDRQSDGGYRPKQEERLSDALKLHLADDLKGRGIVANREVQIRGGAPGRPGERTDIWVEAIIRGPRAGLLDRVVVVVEVKGCWNRGVLTAMRDQLLDRYMIDGSCRHGLYVVGWFPGDQWDDGDPRKHDARRGLGVSIGEARARLAAQAAELSGGGRRVAALILDCTLS